ncbi:MAG: carbamate kinase [Planctomycetota bacterium]
MDVPTKKQPIAIVAMGGHAFMNPGEQGTVEEHHRNAARISERLMVLVERGYNLVITHGNGPQVGHQLLKNELAQGEVPSWPMDVLVAETEGSLGYILQQSILNQLRGRRIKRYVVTVVSQVLVDPGDPAFKRPTKPIGPFLSKEDALRKRKELGWVVEEDKVRGWRRVVPSPMPRKVVQRLMIRDATREGHIVIACGGGGIPIVKNTSGDYEGVEAVLDKDLTASLLGTEIGAEFLIILSDVPNVYLHYGTEKQRPLNAVTLEEIERYIDEGHFPAGSMGPKVDAIRRFLRAGGKRGLITSPDRLPDAMEGRAGTHLVGKL